MIKKNQFNVLQLITGLGVGGAERVVIELASGMQKNGHNVHVVSLNNDDSLSKQYKKFLFDHKKLNTKKNIVSFIKSFFILRKYIKDKKIEVVHAHMFHSLFIATFIKITLPQVRLVFTSHTSSGFGFIRSSFIFLFKQLRSYDVVFGENQHVGLNAKKTIIVKNSVKVEPLTPKDNTYKGMTFLFLGRFEKPKNPVQLIDIFSKIKNKDARLLLAGDGSLKNEVTQQVKLKGLEERVTFLGVVNNVQALLAKVDCLILPSLWEGLPMVLLEAGANGLPVISTPVGSVPELLTNKCGYLSDLDSFSEALDYLCNNEEEAISYGKNLHNKIKLEYSLDAMVNKHQQLYESLINV